MKNVHAFQDSTILFKLFTKTIKKRTNDQKGGFLETLLGTLQSVLPVN